MNIHKKIAALRKAAGLTQEKLGALLGVSPQAVSKWENAECLPDLMLIPDLCAALRISADELLEVSPQAVVKGTALVTPDRLHITTPRGLTLSLSGSEAVQAVQRAELSSLRDLLADEDALRILREMSFTALGFEEDIAAKCNLSSEATRNAIFHLLRLEMCQCTPDGYVLGANAYLAYAALTAAYLASPAGRSDVTSITTSYTT